MIPPIASFGTKTQFLSQGKATWALEETNVCNYLQVKLASILTGFVHDFGHGHNLEFWVFPFQDVLMQRIQEAEYQLFRRYIEIRNVPNDKTLILGMNIFVSGF
jgi:hypothetical protein